jgi:hypothetical protein
MRRMCLPLVALKTVTSRLLWPLGHHFSFLVEMKESPLSKITVSMPQIDIAIRERESGAIFGARVEKAAIELVG